MSKKKQLNNKSNIYLDGGFLSNLMSGKGLGLSKDMNNLVSSIGAKVGQLTGSLLSGGMNSNVGNALNTASLFAGFIPGPYGAIASGSLGLIGGITNGLFGSKINELKLNSINSNINNAFGFKSQATTLDELTSNSSNMADVANFELKDLGKQGLFSNSISNLYDDLNKKRLLASEFMFNSINNNANNIQLNNFKNMMYNVAAFGGLFENPLVQFNSGGTHEVNPNNGILVGVDNQGNPNLVELGETKHKDYIFSNRLKPTLKQLKDIGLNEKYFGKTYSEISKALNKDIKERPNDLISKRGFNASIDKLKTIQELSRIELMAKLILKELANLYNYGGELFSLLPKPLPNIKVIDVKNDLPILKPLVVEQPNKINLFSPTYLRYAPVVGSAIGAISSLFNKDKGIPKDMLSILDNGIKNNTPIQVNTIGNYLGYNPLDRDYFLNKLNSQSSASRRAIENTSGGNRAAAMAGIIASDSNYTDKMGDFFRLAEEYNQALRERVEAFNRGTNQFNSDLMFRADSINKQDRDFDLRVALAKTQLMNDAINRGDNAKSVNLTNLFNSLGDIGREEYTKNMIKSNPALMYLLDSEGFVKYKKNK